MNILECTIKMKQETQKHYEQLAEATLDRDLKRIFSLMAEAEREHIEKMMVLKNNLETIQALDTTKVEESVCVYSPNIDPLHLAEALRHDPDAYRHIVQEEEGVIDFYDRLGDEAENAELKRICKLQAEKEREHLSMLESIYFFVEEPRTYLEWGEFSNLKSL